MGKSKKPVTKIDLPADCRRILVAVSAGIDSTVLAHLLAKNPKIQVGLAYINHQLRSQVKEEEAFVLQLGKKLKAPVFIERIEVGKRPGLQQRARKLRYAALENIASKQGYEWIAVAHNQDDQAETALFRALRGTGSAGLAAMSAESGRIIRPILSWSRKDIEKYANRHRLTHLEDESNLGDDYVRNRLRHHGIPALSDAMGLDVRKPLARLAEIAAWESQALLELAQADLVKIKAKGIFPNAMDIEKLARLSIGRRFGVYRLVITTLVDETGTLETVHLKALDELVFSKNPSAHIPLPLNLVAFRAYDQLIINRASLEGEKPDPVTITKAGQWTFGDYQVRLSKVRTPNKPFGKAGISYIDRSKLSFPLTIRSRKRGDRLRPVGFGGHKKVSDIMIDLKIPRIFRDQIPVLCDRDGIICIPGICVDEKWGISSLTKEAIRVSYQGRSV